MSRLCPQLPVSTVPAGARRVTARDKAPQGRSPGAGITMNKMPRSAMQSDFVVHQEQPPIEEVDSPKAASARSTKIVMVITFIMLAVLALMCAIGPHIPSGE